MLRNIYLIKKARKEVNREKNQHKMREKENKKARNKSNNINKIKKKAFNVNLNNAVKRQRGRGLPSGQSLATAGFLFNAS